MVSDQFCMKLNTRPRFSSVILAPWFSGSQSLGLLVCLPRADRDVKQPQKKWAQGVLLGSLQSTQVAPGLQGKGPPGTSPTSERVLRPGSFHHHQPAIDRQPASPLPPPSCPQTKCKPKIPPAHSYSMPAVTYLGSAFYSASLVYSEEKSRVGLSPRMAA